MSGLTSESSAPTGRRLASSPIYTGGSMPDADWAHDGGAAWAVGVQHYQIVRSSPGNPAAGDGTAFHFRHHPYLAYWGGLFWHFHLAAETTQDSVRGRLHWSSDGMSWNSSDCDEVFSRATHQRAAFYVSSTNRLLVTTWVSGGEDQRGHAGTRLVREIFGPRRYGETYVVKHNHRGGYNPDGHPLYTAIDDAGFRAAVSEMIHHTLYRQQWQEEDQDPGFYAINRRANGHGLVRALCWWTASDGSTVAVWKGTDGLIHHGPWAFGRVPTPVPENVAWSPHGRLVAFDQLGLHGSSKVWGQRTHDGRYAVIGNAPGVRHKRWPMVVSTGIDGKVFDQPYLALGYDIPERRYPNVQHDNKDSGPQYVRGITPGNGDPPGDAMWVVYSSNKEDIWIARIPLGVTDAVSGDVHDRFRELPAGKRIANWNTRSPLWGGVAVVASGSGQVLRLQDADPCDQCMAARVFETTRTWVRLSFKVRPQQSSHGRFEADILPPNGRVAVRLVLDDTGTLQANDSTSMSPVCTYTPDHWLTLALEMDVPEQRYRVTADNGSAVQACAGRGFMERALCLQRLEFRTGRSMRRDFNRRPFAGPFDLPPLADADALQAAATFDLDEVSVVGQPDPARGGR